MASHRATSTLWVICIWSAIPYGPAAFGAASEAEQMAESDYVLDPTNYRLRLWGIHRWKADVLRSGTIRL
jgi:hypothetical protein